VVEFIGASIEIPAKLVDVMSWHLKQMLHGVWIQSSCPGPGQEMAQELPASILRRRPGGRYNSIHLQVKRLPRMHQSIFYLSLFI